MRLRSQFQLQVHLDNDDGPGMSELDLDVVSDLAGRPDDVTISRVRDVFG